MDTDIKWAIYFFIGYAFLMSFFLLFRCDNNINPEIFVQFQNIEYYCVQQSIDDSLTKQCVQFLQLLDYCSETNCSAEYYYEQLDLLGFDLPPFEKLSS